MGVAIYARKSTESEDRQVQSLADQLSVLRRLAVTLGISVMEEITEARSAKEPGDRPQFERLVAQIRAGEVSGLLVWRMDRLSRNMVDGGIIAHLLQTGKLQFIHTADRSYRPSDSALLLAIENGVSTEYIQGLSRNVKRGLEGKAARGWQSGQAPFGYRNNFATHEMEADPERFALLQRGWQLLASGVCSVAEVRRELVRLGLTPRSRATAIPNSLLYKVFRSRFYCGELKFRGEWLPAKHPPMVDSDTFQRVQQVLGHDLRPRDPELKHPYAGLMRCGVCGCQITAETKVKKDCEGNIRRSYTYYHCTGAKGCHKRGANSMQLDHILARLADTFQLNPLVQDWALSRLTEQVNAQHPADLQCIEGLQSQATALERRLTRLRELRIADELSAPEYATAKQTAEHDLAEVRNRLTAAERERAAQAEDLERRLTVLAEVRGFTNLSTFAKRGFIRAISEACFLTQDTLEIRVHPTIRQLATFELPDKGSGSDETGNPHRVFLNWQGELDTISFSLRR